MFLRQDEVLLRSWQTDDAQWYVQARDEQVFKWTTEPQELTVQETELAIQQVTESDDVFSFAIAESESNELLGNIALVRDKTKPRTVEVMYWLAPQGRGRGVATKAVRLVVEWAFSTLNVDQILLQTHVGNVQSQRVAERARFRRLELQDKKDEGGEKAWFVLTSTAHDR